MKGCLGVRDRFLSGGVISWRHVSSQFALPKPSIDWLHLVEAGLTARVFGPEKRPISGQALIVGNLMGVLLASLVTYHCHSVFNE